MSEQDYFVYPDDIDSWNNEAWKQQIEDWAEQNREYHARAGKLQGLLKVCMKVLKVCPICHTRNHVDGCELAKALDE